MIGFKKIFTVGGKRILLMIEYELLGFKMKIFFATKMRFLDDILFLFKHIVMDEIKPYYKAAECQ